jgi:hypothetical protein
MEMETITKWVTPRFKFSKQYYCMDEMVGAYNSQIENKKILKHLTEP